MSLRDQLGNLEHRVARSLLGLPHGVQRALSGGLKKGAEDLHPEMQLVLALRARLGATRVVNAAVNEARARARRDAKVHAGVPLAVSSVRNFVVPGLGGSIPVRHYVPRSLEARPALVVYLHGGGFVLGDLDTHDTLCRTLCHDANVQVLSVDYRLAPEHPFPAAVEDARSAFRWALDNAASLGADPKRVGVAGDSAGGNLAAVTTLFAQRDGEPMPAFQVLLYPTCDRTKVWPSVEELGEGFFLTRADIDYFHAQYTGDSGVLRTDWAISPLCAAPLPRLAPALVLTASFDPLRDEGDAYAEALIASGTPTVHLRAEGLVHGFLNMIAVSPVARSTMRDVTSTLRGMCAGLSAHGD